MIVEIVLLNELNVFLYFVVVAAVVKQFVEC